MTSPASVGGVERRLGKELRVVVDEERHALGDKRRQAARMIEMWMRADDVPDAFGREQLPGFGDHGETARFVLPSLEDDDVVFELDGERDVASRDAIDAVGELLGRSRRQWRRWRRRRRSGHQRRQLRRVRPRAVDGEDECLHPYLLL